MDSKIRILFWVLLTFTLILSSCVNNSEKDQGSIKLESLISEAENSNRFILPEDLADRIINRDPSLKIIDVRHPEAFEAFSIAGAINIPMSEINNESNIKKIDCEKFSAIFYGNSELISEKAWLIYKSRGCNNVHVLKGGLNGWFDEIMNPVEPADLASLEEVESYKTRLAMKNYFLGLSKELEPETFLLPKPKKAIVVKPKKVVVEEEEGC